MNARSKLDIQFVDSHGVPLRISNISIDVVFFCSERERYRFDAGVTDARGHLIASYSDFEKIRNDNQVFALMDYNTKLEECDETVAIRVPSVDELRGRLTAVSKWFPQNEAAFSKRLSVTNNGRIEAPEARATIADDAIATVRLPARTR